MIFVKIQFFAYLPTFHQEFRKSLLMLKKILLSLAKMCLKAKSSCMVNLPLLVLKPYVRERNTYQTTIIAINHFKK
jgi:hypothetical protein